MRIGVIGDVHGHFQRLEAVIPALAERRPDLVLLPGDLGVDPPRDARGRSRQRQAHDESVRRVLGRLEEALGVPVRFVPGNHDLPDPPLEVREQNLDGRLAVERGIRVAGLGGAGPARFGFPYEWGEEEADRALAGIFGKADACDVFLCHTPPRGTRIDLTASGSHVGSSAVAAWLERARPALFVCGHIHEAHGVATCAGVPCLNAGALGEPFGQAITWVVEWSGRPVSIESVQIERGGEAVRSWSIPPGSGRDLRR